MVNKKYRCDICGKLEDEEWKIEIYHRGCRLSQVFERNTKAEKELGIPRGLMLLDVTKLKKGRKKKC